MAENVKKKTNLKKKLAFPIGLVVVLLALTGLVTVIVATYNLIDSAVEKSKNYEQYEAYFMPVVHIDPTTFDDVTKADMNELIEISIWSLLKNDNSPDKFESNEIGLAIPKSEVEKEFVELFGKEVTPTHGNVEGYGIDFLYDSVTGIYTVPLTGVTPIYTPDVIAVQKSTDTVVVTVACLAGDAWAQSENGEMVAPSPDKYLKITLRETDGNLFISAIQNTSAPETANK